MQNLEHITEKTTILTTYLDPTVLKKINLMIDAINYLNEQNQSAVEQIRHDLQDLDQEFTEFVTEMRSKK